MFDLAELQRRARERASAASAANRLADGDDASQVATLATVAKDDDDSSTSQLAALATVASDDTRVKCTDCIHADGHWCRAHPRSGLPRGYIGGIADLLQNCTKHRPRQRPIKTETLTEWVTDDQPLF